MRQGSAAFEFPSDRRSSSRGVPLLGVRSRSLRARLLCCQALLRDRRQRRSRGRGVDVYLTLSPPRSSSGQPPTGWAAPCTRVQEWTCGEKSGRTPFTSCATIPPSKINIPASPSRRPRLGSSRCCLRSVFLRPPGCVRRNVSACTVSGPLKFHWQSGLKNNNEAGGKKNRTAAARLGFNCLRRQPLCFHSVSETNDCWERTLE